jgi:hypothetical protein
MQSKNGRHLRPRKFSQKNKAVSRLYQQSPPPIVIPEATLFATSHSSDEAVAGVNSICHFAFF